MSAFSGPQGKGARQTRRARMRAEAEQRNTATPWERRAKSRRPCPHGKTRGYATEAEARTELVGTNIARNMGKAKRRECRVYECGACGRWHLTSKPRMTGGGAT